MAVQVLNGNELVVQGGLEAGFSLYTGYPGSPLADYFTILHKKRKRLLEKGIRVAIANSEANAAAMASGAKQANRNCLVAMKSMGLHVASDALSVGNYASPGQVSSVGEEDLFPGVVLVVGDDPWSVSTSTPADSRFLFRHLNIPFLEPSTPQELKDWVKKALFVSQRSSLYQGLLLTTSMAEGGGRVEVGAEALVKGERPMMDPNTFDLSKNVMVPPNSLRADVAMIQERFPRVEGAYERLGLDQIFGNLDSPWGVVSAGGVCETSRHVLEEQGHLEYWSLYKLASSFPLVASRLLSYLSSLKALVVIEEKRGFLEEQIRALVQREGLSLAIYGKRFPNQEGFPAHGGLTYDLVSERFERLLACLAASGGAPVSGQRRRSQGPCGAVPKGLALPLPPRWPTFCPGCPHRETLSVMKDLRRKLSQEGMPLLSHGDVGCYSLSFLPPFKEMHNLSAMGQGGALGAGFDLFTKNPSVVLMGDSTFFHSGLTDISNSVQLGHTITYILLDNDNTAMTGHQMTPVSGVSVEGDERPRQKILATVQALGVQRALAIHPSDRYFYQNCLMDLVRSPGVKVIVSQKECALTFHGRKKASERELFAQGKTLEKKTFYQINTLVCEDCRLCVEETGCPGLTQSLDAYGAKVAIDPQICIADSYCTKLKACPSFEEVIVFDYRPRGVDVPMGEEAEGLPSPVFEASFEKIAEGKDFRLVVTGVGGSGVTTISRVLAEASRRMGGRSDLDFKFVDQKGLAQRNGNVTGHLAIYRRGKAHASEIPVGTAELLLSPDLLDGSQHLRFLAKTGLAIFDETFQVPLSLILDKGEEREPLHEKGLLAEACALGRDRVLCFPLKDLSSKLLGKSVYASSMLLGLTWQKGKLPFSLEDLKEAMERVVGRGEFASNWKAFHVGRVLGVRGEDAVKAWLPEAKEDPVEQWRASLRDSFLAWEKREQVMAKFEKDLRDLCQSVPGIEKAFFACYLHDLYVFDRGAHTETFLSEVRDMAKGNPPQEELSMAVRTLARTYFIKDEVFVSHGMISPIKRARDTRAYASLGKRFEIRPVNRPSFDIFGRRLEFDLRPRPWMLRVMRHLRILRALMPGWHRREREMALDIRQRVLAIMASQEKGDERRRALKRLENIKGFREVRYAHAEKSLGGAGVSS